MERYNLEDFELEELVLLAFGKTEEQAEKFMKDNLIEYKIAD